MTTGSENTDEDELSLDPLEEGAEPTERWAEADHFGMTPRETREGEPLDDRLRQEQREVQERDINDAGEVGDNEVLQGEVKELGQMQELPKDNANRAGGSVAESLRDPDES